MAQDPRYRRRGITLDQQSPLDFAASRESIRAAQALEVRLDKISDIAFEKLATKAEKEGKLYGVQNKVTLEQLQDAIDTGLDVNQLFEEGDTVFSASARASQGALLEQDLLNDIQIKFYNINERIKTDENINLDQLIVDINSNIQGYANVISKIDPDRAIKFQAAASTIGTQTINKASTLIAEKAKADNEVKSVATLEFVNQYVEELMRNSTDPASFALLVSERRSNAYALFRRNDSTYAANVTKFEKNVQDAIKSEIANNLISTKNITAFYTGDYDQFNNILEAQGLATTEDKDEIIKLARERLEELANVRKTAKEAELQIKDDLFIENYEKWNNKEMSANDFKEILKENDMLNAEIIKEINGSKIATTEQDERYNDLELEIITGVVNYNDINRELAEGKITHIQAGQLKSSWRKFSVKLKEGQQVIRDTFGILDPDDVKLLGRDDPRKALIARAKIDLLNMQIKARKDKVSFNQAEAAAVISEKYLNVYLVEAEAKKEERVIDVYNQGKIPFDKEKFINLTNDEIRQLKNSRGGSLGSEALLIRLRNDLIKLRNKIVLTPEEGR